MKLFAQIQNRSVSLHPKIFHHMIDCPAVQLSLLGVTNTKKKKKLYLPRGWQGHQEPEVVRVVHSPFPQLY